MVSWRRVVTGPECRLCDRLERAGCHHSSPLGTGLDHATNRPSAGIGYYPETVDRAAPRLGCVPGLLFAPAPRQAPPRGPPRVARAPTTPAGGRGGDPDPPAHPHPPTPSPAPPAPPAVAEPCLAIAADPDDAFRYTNSGNLVAVVTNGTAVLGLGDIGPLAGKPVMEGKAVLFKRSPTSTSSTSSWRRRTPR